MTKVRAKLEIKTILDFSKGKVTRNRIKQAIRKTEVIETFQSKNRTILRENCIRVGMYRIDIIPSSVSTESRKYLREYGAFAINIYESMNSQHNHHKLVHPHSDSRFEGQHWITRLKGYNLRIKHLIDIIYYCDRLNKMRAFL